MLFFHGLFQPFHLGQTLFPAFGGLDAFFPVKAAVAFDDGLLPLDLLRLFFLRNTGKSLLLPPFSAYALTFGGA